MNKRQRERMAKLIECVKKIPNKHFDLNYVVADRNNDYWANYPNVHKTLKDIIKTGHAIKNCGAVGCVMGFCPVFFPRTFKHEEFYIVHKQTGTCDYSAMADFLGISDNISRFMFDPSEYEENPTKSTVIRRMKKVLKDEIDSLKPTYGVKK